jgi:phosphatidylglycerophosphate synthase
MKRPAAVVGRAVGMLGISPDSFTLLALLLAVAAAAFFAIGWRGWGVIFLVAAFLWDALDGSVARSQNKATGFGNYLDAMIDKYVEIIVYAGLLFGGYAVESFFVMTGSLVLSYAKPRAALVIPIDNHDWPALGERVDRTLFLVIAVVISIFLPSLSLDGTAYDTLSVLLWMLAVIVYIGSVQRMLYARKLIIAKC